MSVIDPTPHTLRYQTVAVGYEDENGDWHEGMEAWSLPMKCHAVAAGRADEITFPDGTTSTYSYTVGRLAHDCREFKTGERVRLNIFGEEREYQVKGFHRYRFQSKIWL